MGRKCFAVTVFQNTKMFLNISTLKHGPTRSGEILNDVQVRVRRATNKNKLKRAVNMKATEMIAGNTAGST